MEDINAGGAAFPHVFVVDGPAIDPVTGAEVQDGRKHGHYFPGMTLRDYFAAKALPTMISMCQYADGAWDAGTVAQNAYVLADAMLAERAA